MSGLGTRLREAVLTCTSWCFQGRLPAKVKARILWLQNGGLKTPRIFWSLESRSFLKFLSTLLLVSLVLHN